MLNRGCTKVHFRPIICVSAKISVLRVLFLKSITFETARYILRNAIRCQLTSKMISRVPLPYQFAMNN